MSANESVITRRTHRYFDYTEWICMVNDIPLFTFMSLTNCLWNPNLLVVMKPLHRSQQNSFLSCTHRLPFSRCSAQRSSKVLLIGFKAICFEGMVHVWIRVKANRGYRSVVIHPRPHERYRFSCYHSVLSRTRTEISRNRCTILEGDKQFRITSRVS